MKVDIVVDFSKNHDARVGNQIAEHRVVADVVHLQTVDDFPRWKKEGVLQKYKPVGWDKVFDQIKDKDGHYTGLFFFAISNVTATKLGGDAPVEEGSASRVSHSGQLWLRMRMCGGLRLSSDVDGGRGRPPDRANRT
ncbi:type 2 periplasmic-binding domain-containing protein [Streptomyces ferrugineus]|uniref:hypothetical protein n=1 Tax=Streptomyces ferrugineus TaxID=1413221 RepID=UPI001D13CEE4|nr:hypothetical protein [Streptomyces ferrugineus]